MEYLSRWEPIIKMLDDFHWHHANHVSSNTGVPAYKIRSIFKFFVDMHLATKRKDGAIRLDLDFYLMMTTIE